MTAGPRSERLGVYATLTLSMRLNNSQNDNEESAAAIELNATTQPTLFDNRGARRFALSALAHFCEQSKNLHIHPDQRHHDAECAIPFHVLGRPRVNAGLNEIEIKD